MKGWGGSCRGGVDQNSNSKNNNSQGFENSQMDIRGCV